ncbi:MAG: NFACT RNA binding domain-containing protein [Nanoarchaeota archaeon]
MIDYKKYKWFFTKSGKLVVGGKSAESNDTLLNDLKNMRKELIVMHTKHPGSPFCVIVAPVNAVSKQDLLECAIFTGCFSRAWKDGKKSTIVHSFKLSQLSKDTEMKEGTWSVKGQVKNFTVDLKLAIALQNGVVRAVPEESVSDSEIIVFVIPGKIDKAIEIKSKVNEIKDLNKEQLLSALPAGGVKFVK